MSGDDVFLLDDNAENLELLSGILAGRNIAVRMANSARRGLSIIRAHPPALILLDIVMPDMDGYRVCEQLRSDEATRDIPVIFISALVDTIDKVRAFGAGGVDYVTKPFQPDEVVARVESQLRISRLRKERDARSAELRAAHEVLRRSEERLLAAQEQLSRLALTPPPKLEDPAVWVGVFAAEIARTIGAERIGVWAAEKGELVPLAPGGTSCPSWNAGRQPQEDWDENGATALPIVGTTGDPRGALVVEGLDVLPGSVERRILRAFAAHLGTRLELGRLRAELESGKDRRTEALDLLEFGILFLGPAGEVLQANHRGEEILRERDGLFVGSTGLQAGTPPGTEALRRLIQSHSGAGPDAGSPRAESLALPRPSGRKPLLVSVFQARETRLAGAADPTATLVFVVDQERDVDASRETLMQSYGLTKAEASVAAELLRGRSAEEISEALGVSLNTVRTHIQHLLSKTGHRRQADLVRTLLLGALPVRRPKEGG